MTGPTRDVRFPVTELRIDVTHHLQHHESLQLFGIRIERKVVHDVAVYAAEPERKSNVLHSNFDVLRREHFEIGGTNVCSRQWRPPRSPAPAASAAPGSGDSESASSPRQILNNQRKLLVTQTRTLVLHAGDSGGPCVFVRHLVLDAIERVARGADGCHQVCSYSIGTGGRLSRASGRLG